MKASKSTPKVTSVEFSVKAKELVYDRNGKEMDLPNEQEGLVITGVENNNVVEYEGQFYRFEGSKVVSCSAFESKDAEIRTKEVMAKQEGMPTITTKQIEAIEEYNKLLAVGTFTTKELAGQIASKKQNKEGYGDR